MFCAPLTQEDEDAPRCIEAEINAGGWVMSRAKKRITDKTEKKLRNLGAER